MSFFVTYTIHFMINYVINTGHFLVSKDSHREAEETGLTGFVRTTAIDR